MLRLYNFIRNTSANRLVAILPLLLMAMLMNGNVFAQSQIIDFSSPLSSSWTVDRYTPHSFTSQVSFMGDMRLKHEINTAEAAINRGAQNGSFYNTQGKRYPVPAATDDISVDLYIPAAWSTTGRRMAGFWGEGPDGSGSYIYPIIEYTSDGTNGFFQGWIASGGWDTLGVPAGFTTDSWHTLRIKRLPTGEFQYTVDGTVLSTTTGYAAYNPTGKLSGVILQGYNYNNTLPYTDVNNTGIDYDIYWDNLTTSPAPLSVQGTITSSTNGQICSGAPVSINITVTPTSGGSYSGVFTNGLAFNNVTPAAGLISPTYYLTNTSLVVNNEFFQLQSLTYKDNVTGITTNASVIGGSTNITVYPVPDIDAVNNGASSICSGSPVSISVSNPNGVGGTYSRTTILNGATHTASNSASAISYSTGFNDVLSNTTNAPVDVLYIFTPSSASSLGCVGKSDTVKVTVNPNPTLTGIAFSQVCDGGSTTFTLSGLLPNSTSIIEATTNGIVGTTTLTANSSGVASTVLTAVTMAVNGLTTEITKVTDSTTGCSTTFTGITATLIVDTLPTATYTLNGTSYVSGDTATICEGVEADLISTNATTATYNAELFFEGTSKGSVVIAPSSSYTWNIGMAELTDVGKYWMVLTNTTTGCSHADTLNVKVNAQPVFVFNVNGTPVMDGATDTICQATLTTFALTGGTAGHTFVVTRNSAPYATGTLDGSGGFSNTFISGGNSVNPNPSPTNTPTDGHYEITLTNPVTGCTTTKAYDIFVNPKPDFTLKFNGVTYDKNSKIFVCDSTDATSQLSGGPNLQATITVNGAFVATIPVDGTVNNFNTSMFVDTSLYVVTVSNTITGCQLIDSFYLIKNPLPTAVFTMNTVPMSNGETAQACFGSTVNLTLTNTANAASYSLDHFDGVSTTNVGSGSLATPLAYSFTAANSDAGAYYLTLTSDSGCSIVDTFHLIVNPLPSAVFTINTVAKNNGDSAHVCFGSPVDLTLTNTAFATSYSLVHFDGTTTTTVGSGSLATPLAYSFTAANSDAGYYYLTLMSDSGCSIVDTFNLIVNPLPTATYDLNGSSYVSGDTAQICSETNGILTATNATSATYTAGIWFGGSGTQITTDTIVPANSSYTWDLGAAIYTGKYWIVLTNNATGCTHADTLNVIVNPLPALSYTFNTNPQVSGDTVEVCAESNNALVGLNTSTDNYTATMYHNGTSMGSQPIAASGNFTLNFGPTDSLDEGEYWIELVNTITGCSHTDTLTLLVNPVPVLTYAFNGAAQVSGDTVAVCAGSFNALVGTNSTSGSYTATMYQNGIQLGSNQTIASNGIFNLPFGPTDAGDAGEYWIVLQNTVTGCTHTDTFNVIVNPLPSAVFTMNSVTMNNGDTAEACFGSTVNLTLTNSTFASSYTLTHDNGGVLDTVGMGSLATSLTHNFTAAVSDAGAYYLTLFSDSACSTVDTFNLIVNPLPVYTVEANGLAFTDSVTYCSGNTVLIELAGDAGFTYTVTRNGSSFTSGTLPHSIITGNANNSKAGTYVVVVTNPTTGCTSTSTFKVIVNQKPTVALQTGLGFGVSAVTNVLCYGDNSGSIKYKVSGTNPLNIKIKDVTNDTIIYTLNNVTLPSLSATQSNLTAGAYQIIVFNTFGCSDTLNVTIAQPTAPLSLQVTHSNASCGGGADGSLTFDISGGSLSGGTFFNPTSGYDVTITGPSTNTSFNIPTAVTGLNIPNLGAGVYTINVVDAHGCTMTVTHSIYQPTAVVTTATVTGPATVYTNATANVTFSAPGLVAPITFNYTVNGGATQTAVAATGNSATVAIPTTSIANYTYTITSVTDANGAPCNLTIGSPLVVDVVDGAVPDLRPVVQLSSLTVDSLNPSTSITIGLFNDGALATTGPITFLVSKPAGVSIDFSALTSNGWTVAQAGNLYQISTNTVTINGYSHLLLSGLVELNPTYQTSLGTISVIIQSGSGGETNADNNVASTKINLAH